MKRTKEEIDPAGEDQRDIYEIVKNEKLGLWDFVVAAVIAAGVFLLQKLWEYPAMHPASWNGAAIASFTRPAEYVTPGYWIAFAGWVYKFFGISGGAKVLVFIGHVTLAAISMFVYFFIREVLTFVMRARPQQSQRRLLVMRIASSLGALAFALADPVWAAGQFFGETTLLLAMTVAAIEFFFAFLRKGSLKYSYICAILLGLLIAETPMGILLLFTFISLNFTVIKVFPNLESPFFKPALIEVGKWHMTFFLIAAFIAGVAANTMSFIAHDGLVPHADSASSIPLKYLMDYVHRTTSAAGVAGWILLIGFALGPFVVSMVRFSSAADEENFLSYSTGIVFLFCGVVAFSQCASLSALWFWTYVDVYSSYLLAMCALMCALTLGCSLTILGVDALCRDHQRLAKKYFGIADSEEEAMIGSEQVMRPGLTEALRKLGIVIVPLLLIAALLPLRQKKATRAMLQLVKDTIHATIEEAGKAEYIFTDGNLDPALELESRLCGGNLKCIALIGGGPNAVWLRKRGIEDSEDSFSFDFDGAMGLRSWIRDKPERLEKSAVQIGFDLWKRDGKSIPPIGGLVSLPLSTDEAARKAGRDKAWQLAERAKAIYDSGIGDCTEHEIKNAFFNVEWRLSRMCFYRAESNDLAGDAKAAIADIEMSKALEDRNEKYQQLKREIEKRNEQMMRRLTPREGLQLALVRADFNLGRIYAESILGADFENPDANFAMGMYYQQQHQLSRAEEYLKRCLIRKPHEAAFYNNLAMVQMEIGKLSAAELNANKALKLMPDSDAVRETLKSIQEAKAAKEETLRVTKEEENK